MVNKDGYIIHKVVRKGKEAGMIIIYKNIKRTICYSQSSVYVFDLGYLEAEKDFPEQISSQP
jgi:hypothetical protein